MSTEMEDLSGIPMTWPGKSTNEAAGVVASYGLTEQVATVL